LAELNCKVAPFHPAGTLLTVKFPLSVFEVTDTVCNTFVAWVTSNHVLVNGGVPTAKPERINAAPSLSDAVAGGS